MKRYLIAIAALGLALGANVALAQDQFDDPYWKAQEQTRGQMTAPAAVQSIEVRSQYYPWDDFSP